MLALTLRIGESLQIGDTTTIRVAAKTGRMVKLVISSDIHPVTIIEAPSAAPSPAPSPPNISKALEDD